ncbi:MAG: hypothetical protein AAFX06_11960 [Planctomycetota bacterium]
MSRLARCEVIDPLEVTVAHVMNRTVRRCFLMGDDPVSGNNFDHRKIWIEELLEHFAGHFGIDLLCFSILSNHYHLILRTRPDVVTKWSDTEVARRWLSICPARANTGTPRQPSESDLNTIRNCPIKLAEIRSRLSSISWWMRLLNQRIAQRSNKEDQESGRFWQDRYKVVRLIDEESLLACAVYVELNPLRAGLCKSIEQSKHTSIQRRIQSERSQQVVEKRRDAFLAELTLTRTDSTSESGPTRFRCSHKGFLPLELDEYLKLLAWTVSNCVRRRQVPTQEPPILRCLGITRASWQQLVTNFTDSYCHVAGRTDRIETIRSHQTSRRFNIPKSGRHLLAA